MTLAAGTSVAALAAHQAHCENIFQNKNIKDFIVEPTVVDKMGLNPKGFYEYFGKNYGIKKSIGEYILITNSDDFFKEEYFALRPFSEKLVSLKLEHYGLYVMRPWKESLEEYSKRFFV